MTRTREAQYETCFDAAPVTLDPMSSASWREDPRHFGIVLARYKNVAKMLKGRARVAEIGCGGGMGSHVVGQEVGQVDLYDFDPVWRDAAIAAGRIFRVHDIVRDRALPNRRYDGIYAIDVLEHIEPAREPQAMANICASLHQNGVFIAGCPSLESQVYASEKSKAGHVNCRTGEDFERDMKRYFNNVFLFGMNDEVLHMGFAPMCHYLLVLCVGPIVR